MICVQVQQNKKRICKATFQNRADFLKDDLKAHLRTLLPEIWTCPDCPCNILS